jgi:5,10-methylenetetrahydromethanopterin reductase
VLAEGTGPSAVRAAIRNAQPSGPFEVAVFSPLLVLPDRAIAHQAMAPLVASWFAREDFHALRDAPFYDELVARYQRDGVAGIASMPAEWWHEFGAIGTMDDAQANIAALAEAGATRVALFPSPFVEHTTRDLETIATLKRNA